MYCNRRLVLYPSGNKREMEMVTSPYNWKLKTQTISLLIGKLMSSLSYLCSTRLGTITWPLKVDCYPLEWSFILILYNMLLRLVFYIFYLAIIYRNSMVILKEIPGAIHIILYLAKRNILLTHICPCFTNYTPNSN